MASGSLRNGVREREGSYIFMAGAGQGERGRGCRSRDAERPPPLPPRRGAAVAGGRLLLSPPSPHLRCGRPAPGPPPPVSASAALPLPFPRRWSRAPGDAAPSPAGLPTAALSYLSSRPRLSRSTAPLPLMAHSGAKPSSQPRPLAPSRRRCCLAGGGRGAVLEVKLR